MSELGKDIQTLFKTECTDLFPPRLIQNIKSESKINSVSQFGGNLEKLKKKLEYEISTIQADRKVVNSEDDFEFGVELRLQKFEVDVDGFCDQMKRFHSDISRDCVLKDDYVETDDMEEMIQEAYKSQMLFGKVLDAAARAKTFHDASVLNENKQ
ncbi:hypothetical protein HK098_003620 [Nowakowskiella sp. JEL0407]|nr:hypothetical protein HK098_003620 [Nowakowskiella sp. JEL0407]